MPTQTEAHTMVKIEGIPYAVLLAALYNNQFDKGKSIKQSSDHTITVQQAQEILDTYGPYIHEIDGRVIGVNFSTLSRNGYEFDPTFYDAVRGWMSVDTIIIHLRLALTEKMLQHAVANLGPTLI